jgi:hypothetical protein
VVDSEEEAAAAVGRLSYNELVMKLAAAMEEAESRAEDVATDHGQSCFDGGGVPRQAIDAAALASALQGTLRVRIPVDPSVSLSPPASGDPAESGRHPGMSGLSLGSMDSALSRDSMASAVSRMMADTVKVRKKDCLLDIYRIIYV